MLVDWLLEPPIIGAIVLLFAAGLVGFFGFRLRDAWATGCAGCGVLAMAIGALLFAAGLAVQACASNSSCSLVEVLWNDSPFFVIVVIVVATSGVGLLMLAGLIARNQASVADTDMAPPADQE